MKLNLALAAGLLGVAFLSHRTAKLVYAQSQATDTKLHVDTFTARGQGVVLAADSIERNESVIKLKGNVEIMLRPSSASADAMVLRADEADYLKQGDEIVPRGNVRVTFEKPR
jgi:lipopolysaccharide assembly outer membrane protein LptD (OstA)